MLPYIYLYFYLNRIYNFYSSYFIINYIIIIYNIYYFNLKIVYNLFLIKN